MYVTIYIYVGCNYECNQRIYSLWWGYVKYVDLVDMITTKLKLDMVLTHYEVDVNDYK